MAHDAIDRLSRVGLLTCRTDRAATPVLLVESAVNTTAPANM